MFTCKDKCIMVGYSMFLYLGFTIFAMLDIIYVDLIRSNSIICSNIIYIILHSRPRVTCDLVNTLTKRNKNIL